MEKKQSSGIFGKYMAVLFNEYREKSVQYCTANEEHLFPRTSMMLEDMKKPKGEHKIDYLEFNRKSQKCSSTL